MPTHRKHEHLRTPAEFQQVYDRRRSVSDSGLILYARENGLPYSRIGLSVSKKYGGAVQRNRLRRLYREAFRLNKEHMPAGLDLVLIPRTQQEPALADLCKTLIKLVKQAHKKILKDVAAPETKAEAAGESAFFVNVLSHLWGGTRWLLNGVVILIVLLYRAVLRPLLPPMCRFEPSCSEYMIQAVRKYGPIRGGCKGVCRILRCHPWHPGGYDPP